MDNTNCVSNTCFTPCQNALHITIMIIIIVVVVIVMLLIINLVV